ncbi:adenylate cyclase [Phocicoccus schoeneichii]|uniref:CYTH domain protein n=1 Tax=Phocicoccus schoeneichii TaxID=1812261 RepID=A0A6V7R7E4_9BACL|nr:CYTH domain-containing protein [Jeotgalicoccus schoeneichii]GGH50392.1 adenylate cyclase [Jeotgalicoccus schoeneichii]CAD2072934.1 CYTH domain protein [Jeotgalicoccus schoeneichii]
MIETEIEFKNLITSNQFKQIRDSLFIDITPFYQTNFYIDTEDLQIRKNILMLRIRELEDRFVLTLKVPNEAHVITEYHQILDESVLEKTNIDESDLGADIINVLKERNIDTNTLKIQGQLETIRYERTYKNGLLVLDESQYFGETDYELEFEAKNVSDGKVVFNEILDHYDIQRTEEVVKSERFYRKLVERKDG